MLNEGVCMHPSQVILAYCDESLLHMEVPRPNVIGEPTHFRRRSASLIKEFWTLCILLMTDSEAVETIPYSNIGLTHCL